MRAYSGRLRVLTTALLGVRAHCTSTSLPSDAISLASTLYSLSPPPRLVAIITGGGAQLAPWLLATPGASRTVLEVTVPYARASLTSILGVAPDRS